uniref:Uncharacterized protein n=1 Tax=Rhipicephalus appendiculatus TaxID=34631 RepID=A0A131YDN3_RHIAP
MHLSDYLTASFPPILATRSRYLYPGYCVCFSQSHEKSIGGVLLYSNQFPTSRDQCICPNSEELTLLKCVSHADCILYFIIRTARQLSSCDMIAFFVFFTASVCASLGEPERQR